MSMKLYNHNLSPFAGRTRLQVRAKGLGEKIELVARPDAEIYRTICITGRMPALEIDGFVLPESETIAEFIEDTFPEPSLRGTGPLGAAKVRLFARLTDIYLMPALNTLFAQNSAKPRDPAKVDEGLTGLGDALDLIANYLPDGTYAAEERLTLADCALAPPLFFCNVIPLPFGGAPFLGRETVKRYYERLIAEDAECARVVSEMSAALQEFLAGRR
jgi:glutathione S-transferase